MLFKHGRKLEDVVNHRNNFFVQKLESFALISDLMRLILLPMMKARMRYPVGVTLALMRRIYVHITYSVENDVNQSNFKATTKDIANGVYLKTRGCRCKNSIEK